MSHKTTDEWQDFYYPTQCAHSLREWAIKVKTKEQASKGGINLVPYGHYATIRKISLKSVLHLSFPDLKAHRKLAEF